MKKIILLLAMCFLSACSTIYFDNGPEPEKESQSPRFTNWHHVALLGLLELSDPVDLSKSCEEKQWSSVRVEQDVPQAIITLFIGGFYSPWDIQYSCAEAAKPMMMKPTKTKGTKGT